MHISDLLSRTIEHNQKNRMKLTLFPCFKSISVSIFPVEIEKFFFLSIIRLNFCFLSSKSIIDGLYMNIELNVWPFSYQSSNTFTGGKTIGVDTFEFRWKLFPKPNSCDDSHRIEEAGLRAVQKHFCFELSGKYDCEIFINSN